jgi:ATPase subunit of ABC transporter with duplicated ATPase domains
VEKRCRVLSGGEKARLVMAMMLYDPPNFLVLDEPTNHLDMESIESLNTALDKYTGTLVFVSHDREFVSSLATRIIELRPGAKPGDPATVIDFQGNYEDFLERAAAESAAA